MTKPLGTGHFRPQCPALGHGEGRKRGGERWKGWHERPTGTPRAGGSRVVPPWGLSWQMKPGGVHSCQQDPPATVANTSSPGSWFCHVGLQPEYRVGKGVCSGKSMGIRGISPRPPGPSPSWYSRCPRAEADPPPQSSPSHQIPLHSPGCSESSCLSCCVFTRKGCLPAPLLHQVTFGLSKIPTHTTPSWSLSQLLQTVSYLSPVASLLFSQTTNIALCTLVYGILTIPLYKVDTIGPILQIKILRFRVTKYLARILARQRRLWKVFSICPRSPHSRGKETS